MMQSRGQLQESFLQAIQEQPEDDVPRLIFADWLEDHGQTERAEFIRVQIEQARLPPYTPRARLLDDRWRTLATQHGDRWDTEVRELCQWVWYDRGMVERVGFDSLDEFLRAADQVFALAPIRHVWIKKPWPHSTRWVRCPHLARLGGLRLGDDGMRWGETGRLPGWGARSLARALAPKSLSGLSELDLGDNYLDHEFAAVFVSASHLSRLTTLNLYGNSLGVRGAETLAAAAHLGGLVKLNLCGNGIGDRGFSALARAPVFSGLRELDLGHEANYDHRNHLGPTAIQFLIESPTLTELRVLDLYKNDIGDEGARQLASWPGLAKLADLNVAANGLTDAGLEALAASPYATGLVRLGVAYNAITDRGLQAVLDSPYLKDLAGFRIDGPGDSISKRVWRALVNRLDYGLEDF